MYWADPGYSSGSLTAYYSSTWKRAFTTFSNAQIEGTTNLMNDIDQGAIGDCYFLSALSAIGEWPSRLSSLFLTNTTNKAGVFAATVYIKGIPNTVVIDDFLPFTSKGQLVFDNISSDGSLYAPLMEKVWAKVNGNYENIIAGMSEESLGALLGSPAVQFTMT
jgi:calpain-15